MVNEYDETDEVAQRDARNAEYLKQEAEQDKQYAKKKAKGSTPQRKTTAAAKPQPSALDAMLSGLLKPVQPVATFAAGLISLVLVVHMVLKFFTFIKEDIPVHLLGHDTLPEVGILLLSACVGTAVTGFLYRTLPKVKTVHVNLIALLFKILLSAAAGFFTYKYVSESITNLNWF